MGDAAEERLDGTLVSGFAEHLAECASCRHYFEHLRLTRVALRDLPLEEHRSGGADARGLVERFKDHFRKKD